jgi:hypothetical protein
MIDLKLNHDQRSIVMMQEIEYQLTIMKQYISVEETRAYLLLLNKYGSLIEREHIIGRYRNAWGDTLMEVLNDE